MKLMLMESDSLVELLSLILCRCDSLNDNLSDDFPCCRNRFCLFLDLHYFIFF